MRMTGLLFDYDGTLHESLRIYAPAMQAAYDRLVDRGLAPPRRLTDREVRTWIGLPPEAAWEQLLPGLPEAEKRRAIEQVGAGMLARIEGGGAQLYPGVPEALSALKQSGRRMVLLSSCPRSYLDAHDRFFHLSLYFDGLFCGEDFGYQPKYRIVPALMERYGGPFLVVGDRAADREAAERNHLRFAGCLYGYGSAEELAGADALVHTPQELQRVLSLFC